MLSSGIVSIFGICLVALGEAASPAVTETPPICLNIGMKRQGFPQSPPVPMTEMIIPLTPAIKRPKAFRDAVDMRPPSSRFLMELDLEALLDEIPLTLRTFRDVFRDDSAVSSMVDSVLTKVGNDFAEDEIAILYFRCAVLVAIRSTFEGERTLLFRDVISRSVNQDDEAFMNVWPNFEDAINQLRTQVGVLCLSSSQLITNVLIPLERARTTV